MNNSKKILKLSWYYLNSKFNKSKEKRFSYSRLYNFLFLKDWVKDINKTSLIPRYAPIIDVIIPAIERDIEVLKLTITSLRKFSNNPIDKIFIIAPASESLKSISKDYNCEYVVEDSVTNLKKQDINYNVNGQDRSGWLYQQILKLNWNKLSYKKYCLIFDADTILIKPQTFVNGNKIILNCSDEYHLPYYETFKKIFSFPTQFPLSFVSHYMVFEKDTTLNMKKSIEQANGLDWQNAILKNVDYKEISGFSEYESYGHYMYSKHFKKIELNYWYNKSFSKSELFNVDSITTDSKNNFKSISFHWYNS